MVRGLFHFLTGGRQSGGARDNHSGGGRLLGESCGLETSCLWIWGQRSPVGSGSEMSFMGGQISGRSICFGESFLQRSRPSWSISLF